MNRVILMGRLTRDPEIRYSQGEQSTAIARYSLAVDRQGRRDANQQAQADFIPCVAFGARAEFAQKYLKKGMKIIVFGELRVSSYEKDGVRRTSTEVVVSEHEFCESKSAYESRQASSYGQNGQWGGQPQYPQGGPNPDFAPANGNGSYYSYPQGAPSNPTNVAQHAQPYVPADESPEGFTPVESITEDQDLPF